MSAAILVDERVEPESVTPLALHSHLLVKLNGAELALVALPGPWRHLVQLMFVYHKIAKARFRTNAAESPVTSKPSHFGLSQNGPDMDPFPTFPRRVFIFLRRRLCVSDLSLSYV